MKAWGWISMRRSLEDAMNKAFKETTMKNVSNEQLWSFTRRNGAQNWNLREKLSKIGPVRNFDFWSKVNAKVKVKVNWSRVKINESWSGSVPGWVTGRTVDPLSSSYDMSLTWTRADVDILAWLLTWRDDVIWWRQMTSAAYFSAWQARDKSTGAWRRCQKSWRRVRARVRSYEGWSLRFRRSVVEEAVMAARVQEHNLKVRHLRRRMRDSPELTVARVGAWLAFGWPDFWVFLAGGLGACLWVRFRQEKAWCAQIW